MSENKNKKTNLSLDLTPEERRKIFALSAANDITLREQVAIFVREGIERNMPEGHLVVK